jgi:hypothetical protein
VAFYLKIFFTYYSSLVSTTLASTTLKPGLGPGLAFVDLCCRYVLNYFFYFLSLILLLGHVNTNKRFIMDGMLRGGMLIGVVELVGNSGKSLGLSTTIYGSSIIRY